MRNELDFWKPNLMSWRPKSLFGEIQRTMDRALSDAFEDMPNSQNMRDFVFAPLAEIEESEGAYLARFDVPGIPKEDIKIEINDNVLHVYGERKEEQKENRGSTRLQETRYGRFERFITLPTNVDEKRVEASCADGVLSIYLPKSEVAKAREIKIGDSKTFSRNLKEGEKTSAH